MSKNTRNRILLTALAALLLVVVAVGGTMAWLIDSTDEVTNTFTTAGIDITLSETKPDNKTAQMIPGVTIEKDPVVTIDTSKTDIPIWLFVEFDANNTATYLQYNMNWDCGTEDENDDWKLLANAGTNGSVVYYRQWAPGDNPSSWNLIKDNQVKVRENLVENGDTIQGGVQMPTAAETMTFKAYAIQQAGHTAVEDAWTAATTESYTTAE